MIEGPGNDGLGNNESYEDKGKNSTANRNWKSEIGNLKSQISLRSYAPSAVNLLLNNSKTRLEPFN